jgi:hypothetical protein
VLRFGNFLDVLSSKITVESTSTLLSLLELLALSEERNKCSIKFLLRRIIVFCVTEPGVSFALACKSHNDINVVVG